MADIKSNAKLDMRDDKMKDVPRDEKPADINAYEAPVFRTNQPFFDGVKLYDPQTEIAWVKPEGWPVTAGKHFSEHGPSITFTPMNRAAQKILEDHLEKKRAQTASRQLSGQSESTAALLQAMKELLARK